MVGCAPTSTGSCARAPARSSPAPPRSRPSQEQRAPGVCSLRLNAGPAAISPAALEKEGRERTGGAAKSLLGPRLGRQPCSRESTRRRPQVDFLRPRGPGRARFLELGEDASLPRQRCAPGIHGSFPPPVFLPHPNTSCLRGSPPTAALFPGAGVFLAEAAFPQSFCNWESCCAPLPGSQTGSPPHNLRVLVGQRTQRLKPGVTTPRRPFRRVPDGKLGRRVFP